MEISSRCWSDRPEITLQLDRRDDLDKFNGMLLGHYWLTNNDELNQLECLPRHATPPLVSDNIIGQYWCEYPQASYIPYVHGKSADDPMILVEGVCPYHYTKEIYAKKAELLESGGFECLRSRRDNSGRYSEMWCLHLFERKGPLTGMSVADIRSWLSVNIVPGRITLSGEAWGLAFD